MKARHSPSLLPLAASLLLPLPWLVVRFGGLTVPAPLVSVLSGIAILGGALVLVIQPSRRRALLAVPRTLRTLLFSPKPEPALAEPSR